MTEMRYKNQVVSIGKVNNMGKWKNYSVTSNKSWNKIHRSFREIMSQCVSLRMRSKVPNESGTCRVL